MVWVVFLFANGTVFLLFNATVAGAVANISLPAPLGSAPYVAVDGVAVPALLQNQMLTVPLGDGGVVTVKYVPRVGDADGFLYFNLTSPDVFVIFAESGLLVVPHLKILNFTYVDRYLVVVARGPGSLAYTKPAQLQTATTTPPALGITNTTTPTYPTQTSTATTNAPAGLITTTAPQASATIPAAATTTANAAPPATTPATPQAPAASRPSSAPGLELFLLGAAAAAALLLAVVFYRKRGGGDVGLSEVDARILEYLRRRGGAYEAQISKELGIPRTTVYRAVRRLEEAGRVRVERRDGKNWVEPTG
ncbi:MAG: helix-turn-helix domain-containing protein [Pyrobaculum sp.]